MELPARAPAQESTTGTPLLAARVPSRNAADFPRCALFAQAQCYLRLAFRYAMRHAGTLRIDHVMGLHRQFWIPNGADVDDGVYVHYPADELYAITSIESHRARCELVGENLGIVPDIVNEKMMRHGLRGLYVLQLTPNAPISPDSVASLNTHDTPTFAAFSDGDEQSLVPCIRTN